MPVLLPPRAHVVARALHAHLERGDAVTGQARHLLVLQTLSDLEQERLAMSIVQPFERAGQSPTRIERRSVSRDRRSLQLALVPHEAGVAPATARAERATAIDEDLEQPGAERLALTIAPQRPVDPHERLLHGVLRVPVASQHVLREAHGRTVIPLDEEREGMPIPRPRGLDRLGVRHVSPLSPPLPVVAGLSPVVDRPNRYGL